MTGIDPAPGTARLLCDEMLAGLAGMMRAAGHDTALAPPGTADAVLAETCRAEGRVLVSRDRRLVRGLEGAVLLPGDSLDEQAQLLAIRLGLDWCFAPFTRCMRDNTPLRLAEPAELGRIPPHARLLPGPFRACPGCGRLYWPGSHVRRMRERLCRWNRAAEAARPKPG
jgi:uncharacterized protein with PIN domain